MPQIIGADVLGGCKEPERHFALVRKHISGLRRKPALEFSHITIYVERNLGFEAEHMERELRCDENISFYRDVQAGRVGILTTENVKLGAMTMTNVLLREKRIHLASASEIVSEEPIPIRVKLHEQLQIYSLQFKTAETVFQKCRYALSGKVGGLKDDLVICLQLGVYWTETFRLLQES